MNFVIRIGNIILMQLHQNNLNKITIIIENYLVSLNDFRTIS